MSIEKKGFVLSTEATCDMAPEYYLQKQINLLGMTYTINGKEYEEEHRGNLCPNEEE